ncbi:MAG TPA: DMT family transporter [Thermoleophilaceae bacterium]
MSARAWAFFAAISVLWGMPYLFIKVAVDDGVSPAFLSWARIVLAAALLLTLAWRAGTLGGLRGRWRWIAPFAVIEIALPFPLIAAGEQHVASSLAAILIAAVPLFVAILAVRFDPEERVTGRRLVGLFVGLAGVVALVGIDVAGSTDELLGALAILLAALGYAAGPMILKRRLAAIDTRATMGASLAIAALVLTPPALATWPAATPSGDALASIVVLGLFSTAAAFVLWGLLVAAAGPGRAAVITYVAPVVAISLGVLILDERVGAGAAAGLVLILAGSWLATRPAGSTGSSPPRGRSRRPPGGSPEPTRGSPTRFPGPA